MAEYLWADLTWSSERWMGMNMSNRYPAMLEQFFVLRIDAWFQLVLKGWGLKTIVFRNALARMKTDSRYLLSASSRRIMCHKNHTILTHFNSNYMYHIHEFTQQ